MKKFLSILIFLTAAMVSTAAELRLADATGGAPMEVFMQAAMELSLADKLNISMRRILPTAALRALDDGSVDAVIIDRRFAGKRPAIPVAAEALALYISTANPGSALTKAQVGEILAAHRPTWQNYNRLGMDIQRIMLKPLTPSGTLVRRIFGEKVFDPEIFKVDSVGAGFAFSNSASIFFAHYFPKMPLEIKCLYIDNIPPTSASIINGTYPLALHYVIVYREKSPSLTILLEHIAQEKYRRAMKNAGLFVLLP